MFTVGRMKRKPSTPSNKIKYFTQLYNRPDKKAKAAGAFSWGLHCLEQEKYDAALAYFKESIELNSDEAYVKWDHIGLTYYYKKDFENAIESYNKSLELNTENGPVWKHLGEVYVDMGNHKDAVEPFLRANELVPNSAWRNLVNCYINTKKLDKAEKVCKDILELEPENDRGWNDLATVYLHKGDVEGAIASCKKSIEISPRFKYAWYSLGVIYSHERQIEEALKAYDTALEIDPGFEEVKKDREDLLKSSNIST